MGTVAFNSYAYTACNQKKKSHQYFTDLSTYNQTMVFSSFLGNPLQKNVEE